MYDYLYMYMLHDRTEWKGRGGARGRKARYRKFKCFGLLRH